MKTVQLSENTFQKLQKIATPFEDNSPEDVICKLINHWDLTKNTPQSPVDKTQKNEKKTSYLKCRGRGYIKYPSDGLKIRVTMSGKTFEGTLINNRFQIEGEKFNAPSPAVEHVARLMGAENPSYDGWKYMEYYDDNRNKWILLDNLRSKKS